MDNNAPCSNPNKTPNGPSSPLLIRRLKTFQWIFRPMEALEERAKRYGDPFVISKNTSPQVVYFSHPKAIEQIFTADPELFAVSYTHLTLPTIYSV